MSLDEAQHRGSRGQGLQTSVESVMVDYHGSMELDWDTLLRYDGRGQCEERYGDQLPWTGLGRLEVW